MNSKYFIYSVCIAYMMMNISIFSMYQVHSLRTFKYAQHKTIQAMGHFGLPIMGFIAMNEILYKQTKYGSLEDKNAFVYFLIPTSVQITSSLLRHTVTQTLPKIVKTWRPATAFHRSMATMGALLIKDQIAHIVVDRYEHQEKHNYQLSYHHPKSIF